MKASQLSVQPDTVHSDTQGQSVTVFAFTHLLGINLMPRIRNWKDLHFFRPSRKSRYKHIDSLFAAPHRDPLEGLDAGRPFHSKRENLFGDALAETGQRKPPESLVPGGPRSRACRPDDLSSRMDLQPAVAPGGHRHDNKIESYNGFSKWLSFGGDVIGENDPDEQQKHLRYNDLVATAVILQNTVDMTRIVAELQREGWKVSAADLPFLSPYQTSTVKRFGEYVVSHLSPVIAIG
jgi:Tn3 transposase DDE domain